MRIVELVIDEDQEIGIEAISVVENPAIEEDFIALKSQEFQLAEVDKEKRILLGALLVPNKPIYRKNGEDEYYIYFSRETVLKASQMFLQQGKQNNSTLAPQHKIQGLSLVESWIVEDPKMDKTKLYGMELPKGTWVGAVKVNNEQIWQEFVKTGKVKGFSIEGYFADKMERPKESIKDELAKIEEQEAEYLLEELANIVQSREVKLVSYSDYPDAVNNNAQKGIDLNKKVNNKCSSEIGKIRAATLSAGRPISKETIQRMYSFLSRAEEYYDPNDKEACGTISYLLWGGLAGKRYAIKKLKELGELSLASMVVNDDFAIIDDRLAYSTEEKAKEMSSDLGCQGIHQHEFEGRTWYMPCEYHSKEDMYTHKKCPKGYKKKDGKCVKMAEVGERGGIRKSPKAPKSDTPNPNPKGKGTAKGDASTSRGAKVSKKDEATLQNKADDFNERYKEKLGYGVTVGQLKSVFQRGLGAYNTSRSPRVKSPSQWAFARVNAYLYLVKNGRPQNAKYVADNDLLPKKHPKSSKR